MKATLYRTIGPLTLLLPLVACHKDPAPAPPTLVGTWIYVTVLTVTTPKPSGAVTTKTETYTPNALKVTFAADGTASEAFNGKLNSTGTYTYTGNTLVRKTTGLNDPNIGDTYTVTTITDNALVFTVTDNGSTASYFRTYTLAR